jgi:hypothetical protein
VPSGAFLTQVKPKHHRIDPPMMEYHLAEPAMEY